MIAKLLTIALPVNGDDARSFHRYSLRSSNFTFFISKTILFRFVVLLCMCMRVCDHSIACVCFYLLFFYYCCYCRSRMQLECYYMCIQYGWAPVSHDVCRYTFAKHLNTWTAPISIYLFSSLFNVRVLCHNRIEIYIRFSFRLYSRFCFYIFLFLLLFSNWIVFVLFFPFFASSLSASISPLK